MEGPSAIEKYAKINHQEIIEKIKKEEMTKPYVQQPGPYKVFLEANKRYSYCRCGLSKKEPFCDGSHKGIPKEVGIKKIRFTVEKEGEYYLCGCKQTCNEQKIFCDGTHKCIDW